MSTLIAISGLGILCLLLEILNLRKTLIPIVLLALTGILGLTIVEYYLGESFIDIDKYNMIGATGYSYAFSSLFILLTIFVILMCPRFYADDKVKIADYVSLKIFMLAGAVAMVSFGNMIMFFLGLEVLSISAYVLAASKPKDTRSNEAGMKYFIMGAFASSFILLGIALVYGAIGSFNIADIVLTSSLQSGSLPVWFQLGFIMITVGMMFKAAIVPFHFWAPDVYEGSPTLVTAIMSTLVKVAAIGTMFKLTSVLAVAITPAYEMGIIIISILTMFVANLTALRQKNIKRMMAFSGITHAGFMMMSLLALNAGANTVLYYAAAYSLANITAFAVITAVCQGRDNEDANNFFGLAKKQPVMAVSFACALLSLGGIPVFAGFFAKFFIFDQMISAGHIVLVVFGVINSAIAVYYYLRLVNVMFLKPVETKEVIKTPAEYKFVAVAAVVLLLVLGLFPSIIMGLEL
jgi:NADH-quinone oxidoreductase subunit N